MRVYADHNATSQLLPEVAAQLNAAWAEPFANPSATHALGRQTRAALDAARAHVAALVAARPEQVAFTGSATEANASALYGHADPGRHIVVSAIEHPSVLENARRLSELGYDVQVAPVLPSGVIDLARLGSLLDGAGVCAIMWANNETGAVQPIAEIAAITRRHNVRLHVDAVQAAGKLGVLRAPDGVDTLSLSAHKLGGLTGSGALVVFGRAPRPWLLGGGQEAGRRGGTENVHGILAFGWAAEQWLTHGDAFRRNMSSARQAFEAALTHRAVAGATARLPNTSNMVIDGVRAQALLTALDLDGIAASHGSACATGSLDPSPVLLAMGLSDAEARSSLRVSFGPLSNSDEGQRVAEAVVRCAERLQRR